MVGGGEAPEQSTREDQEPDADHTAGEMRQLEQRQRHDFEEPAEALVECRYCAGDQQHRACKEYQYADQLRRNRS